MYSERRWIRKTKITGLDTENNTMEMLTLRKGHSLQARNQVSFFHILQGCSLCSLLLVNRES